MAADVVRAAAQPMVAPSAAVQARAKPNVLVVAHTTTFLTELSLFGALLRARTEANVVFYCSFGHPTAHQFASRCASQGAVCLVEPLAESLEHFFPPKHQLTQESIRKYASVRRAAAALLKRIAAILPAVVQAFLREHQALVARALAIKGLLAAVAPKLVVLGGDMPGYDSALYVKAAHEAGLKVLIVPSTMSNGLEQAEVYSKDPAYHVRGWSGELLSKAFPRWVMMHKGLRLFRCPPGRVLALELNGLAPPEPWVFNSGYADALAMESEAMIDYYVAAGLNQRRMVLTGSLSDDEMARRLASAARDRRELCEELALDPHRLLIVSALPPDFLYLTGQRPECDFKTYADLVEFWIDSLAQLQNCSVVIALHPSVEPASMGHIERGGIRIGTRRTADMVPLCDLYVASVSSTIRWAIACGRPVVNYDVYRYRYTDFLGVPGVLAMEAQSEFRATLHNLVSNRAFLNEVASAQRKVASKWGILDGRVGERMLALVGQLSGIESSRGAIRA